MIQAAFDKLLADYPHRAVQSFGTPRYCRRKSPPLSQTQSQRLVTDRHPPLPENGSLRLGRA